MGTYRGRSTRPLCGSSPLPLSCKSLWVSLRRMREWAHGLSVWQMPVEHAAAAVVSKVGASTITYPWQVVRSRQQQRMDVTDIRQAHYNSMTSTFRWMLR